jgi:hypothetical protein
VLAGSVNTAATVRSQDDETRARIRREFDRIVAGYERDGALHVPVSVKIASGRR